MERAKHAYGNSENLDAAIAAGKIDAFDLLFLDGETDPKIGWLDRDGVVRIPQTDLSGLEAEVAKKADAEEFEKKIDDAVLDVIDIANGYTDQQIKTEIAKVNGAVEVVEF